MNNRTKTEFTSHCRIAAKTKLLMLFLASFAHARYSSRMIDRFLNWGDHGKPKSGKIRGRCQPPLLQAKISYQHGISYLFTGKCNFGAVMAWGLSTLFIIVAATGRKNGFAPKLLGANLMQKSAN